VLTDASRLGIAQDNKSLEPTADKLSVSFRSYLRRLNFIVRPPLLTLYSPPLTNCALRSLAKISYAMKNLEALLDKRFFSKID
jgi:hypothetical protein